MEQKHPKYAKYKEECWNTQDTKYDHQYRRILDDLTFPVIYSLTKTTNKQYEKATEFTNTQEHQGNQKSDEISSKLM